MLRMGWLGGEDHRHSKTPEGFDRSEHRPWKLGRRETGSCRAWSRSTNLPIGAKRRENAFA
jgi:hypothetical protein